MPRPITQPTAHDLVAANEAFGKKRLCCGPIENGLPVSMASVMLTHGFPQVDGHQLDFPLMLSNLNNALNACPEGIRVALKQNLIDIANGI